MQREDYGSCSSRQTSSAHDGWLDRCGTGPGIFVLGVGTLVGWNSLLAAVDLFRLSFPDSPDPAVWFIFVFETWTLLTLLCISQLGERFSFKSRFAFGFTAIAIILACIPIIMVLFPQDTAWTAILCVLGLLAIGSGIVEGSLWGFVSSQRSSSATPAQAGQAFAGVLVCSYRIAVKAFIPSTQSSGLYFYIGGGVFTLGCGVFGYFLSADVPASQPGKALGPDKRLSVLKSIRTLAAANVLTNAMSMAVFPALATRLSSPGLSFTFGWMTVILVSIFAFTDTLGSFTGVPLFDIICHRKQARYSSRPDARASLLLKLAAGRLVLLPLFLLQACHRLSSASLAVTLVSILGYTQGALSVAVMKESPGAVMSGMGSDASQETEHAGYLMTIATLLGVCFGASLSIPLNMFCV